MGRMNTLNLIIAVSAFAAGISARASTIYSICQNGQNPETRAFMMTVHQIKKPVEIRKTDFVNHWTPLGDVLVNVVTDPDVRIENLETRTTVPKSELANFRNVLTIDNAKVSAVAQPKNCIQMELTPKSDTEVYLGGRHLLRKIPGQETVIVKLKENEAAVKGATSNQTAGVSKAPVSKPAPVQSGGGSR